MSEPDRDPQGLSPFSLEAANRVLAMDKIAADNDKIEADMHEVQTKYDSLMDPTLEEAVLGTVSPAPFESSGSSLDPEVAIRVVDVDPQPLSGLILTGQSATTETSEMSAHKLQHVLDSSSRQDQMLSNIQQSLDETTRSVIQNMDGGPPASSTPPVNEQQPEDLLDPASRNCWSDHLAESVEPASEDPPESWPPHDIDYGGYIGPSDPDPIVN